MTATRLSKRALVRLTPLDESENVAEFLQGLVTNDVSGKLPVYAALLSAQGKVMSDFFVWNDGDALLLDCEADIADDLVKRLSLYRLRRKIEIARDAGLEMHWSVTGSTEGSPDPRMPGLGNRWIASASDADTADGSYLAHRLALGVPEGQTEMGDTLWLETNAVELNGVSFEKGCYIGQENTARMNWRQKVNRRLVVVPIEQSEEKRRKAGYPDLGLAVDHLRVTDLEGDTLPDWQSRAIAG